MSADTTTVGHPLSREFIFGLYRFFHVFQPFAILAILSDGGGHDGLLGNQYFKLACMNRWQKFLDHGYT